MRKPLIICIAFAIAGALTASLAMGASTRTVKVGDNWFYKSSGVPKITVKRNTTVRFKWLHSTPHDVYGYRGSTSGTPRFHSVEKHTKDAIYKRKLTTTGTYTIVCEIHGEDDQSMKIKVVNP